MPLHWVVPAKAGTHALCPLVCTKSGLPDFVIKEAAKVG